MRRIADIITGWARSPLYWDSVLAGIMACLTLALLLMSLAMLG